MKVYLWNKWICFLLATLKCEWDTLRCNSSSGRTKILGGGAQDSLLILTMVAKRYIGSLYKGYWSKFFYRGEVIIINKFCSHITWYSCCISLAIVTTLCYEVYFCLTNSLGQTP